MERLKEEDRIFEELQKKNIPTNAQKLRELMDTKRQRDIKPSDDDLEYQKLVKQLESAEKRLSQFKSDMNMIVHSLEGMDPTKKAMAAGSIDKRFALENLKNRRVQIRDKEVVFLDQLKKFEDYYSFNERNRIEKGIVNQEFIASKKSKILELKLMQEQLDHDKIDFLDQFEKARAGFNIKTLAYFSSIGVTSLGPGGKSSHIGGDYDLRTARERLQDETKRIELMKQDQLQYYSKNQLPINPEEFFAPGTNPENEVNYFVETNKYAQTGKEKYHKLKEIRENLEKFGAEKGLVASKIKLQVAYTGPQLYKAYQSTLSDIERLRREYVQEGGIDPEFLLNMQMLQDECQQLRMDSATSDINLPNILKNIQGPLSARGPNMHTPIGNGSFLSFRNKKENQSHHQLGTNLGKYENISYQEITNHPIYGTLPNSFKKAVLELEQRNKSLNYDLRSTQIAPEIPIPMNLKQFAPNAEERMLNYVREQESGLIIQMSRLSPNQVEYTAKFAQFQQVQKMKANLEKSVLDKKVQDAIRKGGEQSQTSSTMGIQNVSIVAPGAEGNDLLLNNDLGSLQRSPATYTPNEGFVLRWDWIGSLPMNYKSVQIAYGTFRQGENFFGFQETIPVQAEQETQRSNKCIFIQKEIVRDVLAFQDSVLYCEFRGLLFTRDGLPGKLEIIGWSMHKLFDHNGLLFPGKFKLPFYSKSFIPNDIFKEGLPYMTSSALFIRICLPMDPYFDLDSTVMLQNEYKLQDLHLRRRKILNIDEPFLQSGSDRNLNEADQNSTLDQNHSPALNQHQSTLLLSQKQRQAREDNPPKMPNASQFQIPGSNTQFGYLPDPNKIQADSFRTLKSRAQTKTTIANIPVQPSQQLRGNAFLPQISMHNDPTKHLITTTSIDQFGNDKKGDQEKSIKIKLNKLVNAQIDVRTIQVRSVIFSKNDILLNKDQTPSVNNVKLEDVENNRISKEITLNSQINQLIDWKDILSTHSKKDLEKIIFYCALFKYVSGKEDELIAWIVWPLFKVENDVKSVNTGIFSPKLFKKPAQKPPFGEKKNILDMQLNFEIEAVGRQDVIPSRLDTKKSEKQNVSLSNSNIILDEEEKKPISQTSIQVHQKEEVQVLDNNSRFVVDLIGLQKYFLVKNDLQYRMDIQKDGITIFDENAQKCIEQNQINIREKGKDTWKFDTEQRFQLGQVSLTQQFNESTFNKAFLVITIMTQDKSDIVGVARAPIFVNGTSKLSQGRNKMELFKMDKDGNPKPVRYILDYQLNYINYKQLDQKQYDPNQGLKVFLYQLSNYKEKFEVNFTITGLLGNKVMDNNLGRQNKVISSNYFAFNLKDKMVSFKLPVFLYENIQQIKNQSRRHLDDYSLLFEFNLNKSESNPVPFAWYSHKLFTEQGELNAGKFNEQVFQLPIANEFPVDPKKMKKFLVKFEYEISEDTNNDRSVTIPQNSRPQSQAGGSVLQSSIDSKSENKFNIFLEKAIEVKFQGTFITKSAIIFKDDLFPTDTGIPCLFEGQQMRVNGTSLELNEEYDIDIDVEILKKKHSKELDFFYFFVNIIDSNQQPILWFLTKLFDKGQLRVGKFQEKAFDIPVLVKLSTALQKAKKSTSIISFEIKKGFSDILSDD